MYPTPTSSASRDGAPFAGLGRLCRNAAVSLAVALLAASCSSVSEDGATEAKPEQVFNVGFASLSERYIERVDLNEVGFNGLTRFVSLDPSLRLSREGATIRLAANDRPAAEWRAPAGTDAHAWADVASQVVAAARGGSVALQGKSSEEVYDAIFRGGLTGLDKYSRYTPAAAAHRSRAMRDGFGGLGVTISYKDGDTEITKVHPNTPAQRAGVQVGDVITHVDGRPIHGIEQRGVIEALRGPINSQVRLRIARKGVETPVAVQVTRELIIIPTVEVAREGGILNVKVTGFNQGTARSVRRNLARAEREMGKNLTGIILDLRGNPGGLLDQAVDVVDLFLTSGPIISTIGRHFASEQHFDATWGELAEGVPMAVLINGRSASASEIVAVALRDRGRAVVVGSSSYGKGTVQTIVRLPNGGELTITWARMHAPSGIPLQDHGIIPAICTSGPDGGMAGLMNELRGGDRSPSGFALLSAHLRARLAVSHSLPDARKNCPQSNEEGASDVETAKLILMSKGIYAKILEAGRPAVAARLPGS